MRKTIRLKTGQALVTLLVFSAVALIVTSAAVMVTIINSQTTAKFSQGEEALAVAEAGVENAIIQIKRNSAYSGETISVGDGTATITVSGASIKTITAKSSIGDFKRTLQVTGYYSSFSFSIQSWQEID